MAADIQEMYHQVQIIEQDNTSFLHLQLYDVPTATKTRGINGRSATTPLSC